MKISVIMPTYNRHDCIWLPLEAMVKQTFKNWEMFIIDDGSDESYVGYLDAVLEDMGVKYEKTDTLEKHVYAIDTLEKHVYAMDTSVIYLYELKYQGHPALVRNFAKDKLTGDLVCFRDDDGYWDKTFLEKMSKPFLTKDVIMTYCYRNISHFRSLYDFKRIYDQTPNFPDEHGANYDPQHMGEGDFNAGADTGDVMLRTDVFQEVGGFGTPAQTGGQEDFVLWKAVMGRYHDKQAVPIREVLNYYIWHKAGVPNRTVPE